MKLSIIIPCYNEKGTIAEILKRIKEVDLGQIDTEIIVVDDGSKDSSSQILKGLRKRIDFKLLSHQKNLGKGQAVRTGLKFVSGDYLIIQDADLEYNPCDYQKILECALKNNAEVVYGSRRLNPENRKKYSYLSFYIGGIILTWFVNILYGAKITDEATGYKLFKTEVIKKLGLRSRGFDFCPEITAKIAKRKIKIYEVPISYFPRYKKEGKKIKWKDGFGAIWTLIKYKFID